MRIGQQCAIELFPTNAPEFPLRLLCAQASERPPEVWQAVADEEASAPSSRRDSTMFCRLTSGLFPGRDSIVLRPMMTTCPSVRARKCFMSSGRCTSSSPRYPMPRPSSMQAIILSGQGSESSAAGETSWSSTDRHHSRTGLPSMTSSDAMSASGRRTKARCVR